MKNYKIKKGDRFHCIKDFVMENDETAFVKGYVYVSDINGCLTNNLGDTTHEMENLEDFSEHFKPLPSEDKNIDKVTVDNLGKALKAVGINMSDELIDNIIDLVELIEEKGDETTLKDLSDLQAIWAEEKDTKQMSDYKWPIY
jgi:hypothetical protein